MEITLTGFQVLYVLGVIALCLLIAVGLGRVLLRKLKRSNNYKKHGILQERFVTMGLGSAASLSIIFTLMSWTTYDDFRDYGDNFIEPVIDEIDIIPPQTIQEPPKLPPIVDVTDEIIAEEPDLEPLEIDVEDVIEAGPPPPIKASVARPPLPPPPVDNSDDPEEIFVRVEKMPMFGGCTDKACSDKKLFTYLSKQVRYPAPAKDNNIEGRVTAQFIIEKDGSVTDIKVLRGIGAGCDKEVLRVIQNMNELENGWTSGEQRGEKVRVKFTLPVSFKLQK